MSLSSTVTVSSSMRRVGPRQQVRGQVRPDETGGAGDEDAHANKLGDTTRGEARRRPGSVGSPREGNRPRRWHRLSSVADHARRQQAVAARVRQADGPLPDRDADDGGAAGDPHHHHARGAGGVPAPAGRRQRAGGAVRVRGAAEAGGPGPGVHPGRGLPRRGQGRPGAGRQHLPRSGPGAPAERPDRGLRRACVCLRGRQPDRVRGGGVRRGRPGAVHRGEARQAEEPVRGAGPVLLRRRRGGHRPRGASRARAASWRSPPSTTRTCSRGGST